MKKLMFAAAAIAAGVACADITSANVVGFHTYDLEAGFNLYAPTFEGISKALNIQDIKLIGAVGDGTENIQILDNNGVYQGSYAWYAASQTGEDHDGWFDFDDAWKFYDFDINEGEGFYLYIKAAGVKVQVAGQVKLGSWEVPLAAGFNLVGNASPTKLNIQDIKLVGAVGDGTENIQILDSNGVYQGSYAWYAASQTGEDHDGWFDFDDAWKFYDFDWPAGKGMYLYVKSAGVKLTLPQVLPAK